MSRYTKIGTDGKPLPADAETWEAVADSKTGLMWTVEEKKVSSQQKAEAAAKKMTTGGFDDWRLPSVEELFPLPDRTKSDPAIDTAFFPKCKSDWYWTSTLYAPSPGDYAWYVNFSNGNANYYDRDSYGFVRTVRGGQ
jgi:uncharacterized protein DUF1566